MVGENFGRLERVVVREGWKDEARDFTPWLAENLDRLSQQLGLALELREVEHQVGRYSLDILAEDVLGRVVIIENQRTASDHGHLGQLLTYCAGTNARVVIWVASNFTEEHLAVLEWFNQNTIADVGFYAVEVELLKIGDSPLAPNFRVLARPNELVKESRSAVASTEWNWEHYAAELGISPERLAIARRLVGDLETAIERRGLPWQPKFRKGYVAFQRAGGYNVVAVDLMWNKPVRLWIKLPDAPAETGLASPYPQLAEIWVSSFREWGWNIPSVDAVPDVEPLVGLAAELTSSDGTQAATAS